MAGGKEGKEEEREIRKGREKKREMKGKRKKEGKLKVHIHAHFVCPFYYWLPFLYTAFLSLFLML